jgi:hypothetical protein
MEPQSSLRFQEAKAMTKRRRMSPQRAFPRRMWGKVDSNQCNSTLHSLHEGNRSLSTRISRHIFRSSRKNGIPSLWDVLWDGREPRFDLCDYTNFGIEISSRSL